MAAVLDKVRSAKLGGKLARLTSPSQPHPYGVSEALLQGSATDLYVIA